MGSSTVIKIDDALSGVVRLGLDTAPVIYFIEANPSYDELVTEIFQRVSRGALTGVTSVRARLSLRCLSGLNGAAYQFCSHAVAIFHNPLSEYPGDEVVARPFLNFKYNGAKG